MIRRARRASLTLTLLAAAVSAASAQEQARPFTTADALEVESVRIADVTEDGGRVAATIQTRRGRLNVDHFRFGDPTYIAPSLERLMVVSTAGGERRWLHEEPVQLREPTWSPDGRRLAYFLLADGRFGLRIHDAQAGSTRDVSLDTPLEISAESPLVWAPDGRSVLLTLRPQGWAASARQAFLDLTAGPVIVQDSRNAFLAWDRVGNMAEMEIPALVSVDDGSVRQLLPRAAAFDELRFAPDGKSVTYVVTTPTKTSYERNGGATYQLFRLPLGGAEPESLMGPTERRISVQWSPEGGVYAYDEAGDVFVRDLDDDRAENLTASYRIPLAAGDSTRMSFSLMRWSPDGEEVLVSSQKGWHLVDADGGEPRSILAMEAQEEARPEREVVGWSDDGRRLYFSYSARDRWERGLKRLDLEDAGAPVDLIVDRGLYRSWTVSADGSRVVYQRSDGDRPDELWIAEGDFTGPRALTQLNAQLEGVALTRSELVHYLDVDGRTQYGILYYPVGYEPGRRYPLVAEIYEDFFDNGYNENMNLITSQGWFGFRPSVSFEEGYPGEAWLKGVTTGINELIERGLVDERRIGVYGQSYGGYAVNLLITQTDRFAAAVNISGKVNLISFLGDSPKITTRNYRAAEIGQDRIGATLWEQPQKYIAHSAVMFADRIDTPLLMLSGEGDWNVPATNQREMYYALRRLGKEVVWVHYTHAGHGAGRASTESDFHDHWRRMIEWFGEHFDGKGAAAVSQGG